MSSLVFSEKYEKEFKVSSAVVMISTLRVKYGKADHSFIYQTVANYFPQFPRTFIGAFSQDNLL